MKKHGVIVAFFFVLISLFFTSCLDFWLGIFQDVASSVKSIWLYAGDRDFPEGEADNPVEISVGEKVTINYEIEYDVTNSKPITFYLKSSNEDVAKPAKSEIKTSLMEGTFDVEAVGEGDCQIRMYITGYEEGVASSFATAGFDVIYIKVTPEKTVKIVDSNGNPLKNLTLYKGDSMYLSYINTYDNRSVKWNSSNGYIVEVNSNGYIKALQKGDATITLSTFLSDKKATCDVTVLDAKNWSVSVSGSKPAKFYPKDKFKLNCTVNVDSGVSQDVNWESDNKAVAIVGNDGTVTAVSAGKAKIYAVLANNTSIKSNYFDVEVLAPPVSSNQFFWGKWQRMDNGKVYDIQETSVSDDLNEYDIVSSTATELVITTLGKFTKDSDRIIKWHDDKKDIDIPFYRQGGTDLKYKLRVVGFADEIGGATGNVRAASTDSGMIAKKGLKVKAQSEKYSTYNDEATTDNDGYVELKAPVQGDSQTITVVDTVTNEIVVVPGLKIDTDGANMGTIPLVGKEDYSLKVTGTIADKYTKNGYLYGNNYKTYPLTLTITNISEIMSATSSCKISTKEGDNLNLKIVNSRYELDDVGISAMKSGATKTIDLEVSYGSLVNEYVDTEIIIEVTNMNTMRTWVDYVPLRFFAGDMPITISAASTEGNNETLNGFLIYPDGNSTFFNIKSNSSDDTNYYKTLYIPVFGKTSSNPYRMVFCGANVTGNLGESTEMFYTVNLDSTEATKPILKMKDYYMFGENGKQNGNDSEDTAYEIKESFEGYLGYQDIDFYTLNVESKSTVPHDE